MSAAGLVSHDRLRSEKNPFAILAPEVRAARPLQAALGELIRLVGLETAIVIIAGSEGTGKSTLLDMAVRSLSGMGLSTRTFKRGDPVAVALGERFDVLLIDDADDASDEALDALLRLPGARAATTTVLVCLPSSVLRLMSFGAEAAIMQLQAFSATDAKAYLLERSASMGHTDLFAADALELVVNGSQGMPRRLRTIAERAYMAAVQDGSAQIALDHVAFALAPDTEADDAVDPERRRAQALARRFSPAMTAAAVKPPAVAKRPQTLRAAVVASPAVIEAPAEPPGRKPFEPVKTASGFGFLRRAYRAGIRFAHASATFIVVFILVAGAINALVTGSVNRNRPIVSGGPGTGVTSKPGPAIPTPSTPSGNHAVRTLLMPPMPAATGAQANASEANPVRPVPKPRFKADLSEMTIPWDGKGSPPFYPVQRPAPAIAAQAAPPVPSAAAAAPAKPSPAVPATDGDAPRSAPVAPVTESTLPPVPVAPAALVSPAPAAPATHSAVSPPQPAQPAPVTPIATAQPADRPTPAQGAVTQAPPAGATRAKMKALDERERLRERSRVFFGSLMGLNQNSPY